MQTAPNPKNYYFSILKGSSLFFILLFPFQVFAEQLPLKIYSSADGLANDAVNRIVPDSREFLWICTGEGLSRFDGFRFKNYTQEQGLPHPSVSNLLETKDGDYLLATSGGLVVFNPLGKAFRWNLIEGKLEQTSDEPPMFKTYLTPEAQKDSKVSKSIVSLATDRNGTVYAGTTYGLFKFLKSDQDWYFEKVEFEGWKNKFVGFNALLTDSKKNLWIVTNEAIYVLTINGTITKINESGGNSIFEDRSGNVWVDSGGNDFGIRVYSYLNENQIPTLTNTYTTKDGLSQNHFTNAMTQTLDGKIFVTSNRKLHEYFPNAKNGEPKFRQTENELLTSATDKHGNLWFSTHGKGFARYLPNNFYTFAKNDGSENEMITSIFGNRHGEIFLTLGKKKLGRVHDGKVETLQPFGLIIRDWIEFYLDFQSQDSEFWIPSNFGLLRYPKVAKFTDLARTPPKKIYTTADGLFIDRTVALFEDSSGDVWLSSPTDDNSLLRWEKSTDKIHRYTFEQGLPKSNGAVSFGEDTAGNIWIGYYFGQIFRYKDGKFRDFTEEGLIPRSLATKFLTDKKGRLWFSTSSKGIFRVAEPNAEKPVFTSVSTANGLSSNITSCLAEDNFHRLYIGTGNGINRLDMETGRIKIFTQNDGLPSNLIQKCYADVNGNLWFSSLNSLIRFTPENEKISAPPPMFIDAISVNGKPQAISELGEKELTNLELESDERQIQISFFAISFDLGETLRYQYKINEQGWSEPSGRRTVDFNLSPGTYNFAVRAITANGVLSENSATISLTIAHPIWQRWWFILLVVLTVGSVIFAVVRYRLRKIREVQTVLEALNKSRAERLAELQRVRTRIATDLHDDIGSSLTQISLYSELARQKERESGKAGEQLDIITNVANELVDTMSDIVWAINPKKDHLQDLTQRMRRFAANILTAKDIDLEFNAPDSENEIPLGANIRREVFLIFKETINNIAKHSEATEAKIKFSIQNNQLIITFEDNGKGFNQNEKLSENGQTDWRKFRGGNGLLNMRKRAAELGGDYEIKSDSGKGTIVILIVPLEIIEETLSTDAHR